MHMGGGDSEGHRGVSGDLLLRHAHTTSTPTFTYVPTPPPHPPPTTTSLTNHECNPPAPPHPDRRAV